VLAALGNPRTIDIDRVNAQQARRILDRLVGYEISPLISRKMHLRGLSAGRVQSVALRLIVEREREILAFVPREYWSILARLSPLGEVRPFQAVKPYSQPEKLSLPDEPSALEVVNAVRDASWRVADVRRTSRKRRPRPPFITSTLQQAASSRYGFSPGRTMQVAQGLYEGKELGDEGHVGLITYMRTDSTRVAQEAQAAAREYIGRKFGADYVPSKPPVYKMKKAQDAHEAIRPTQPARAPAEVAKFLDRDELKLYTLIWERFLASQMADAQTEVLTVDVEAAGHLFRASGTKITFPGWLAVLADSSDPATGGERGANGGDGTAKADGNGGQETDDASLLAEAEEGPMPDLEVGQDLTLLDIAPRQHFTQPPPRYTEASLIAALEELGVGRPSTYAPTVDVIKQRKYVGIESRKFVPTSLGTRVSDLLVEHFGDIVKAEFTAEMEEQLDAVEDGKLDWQGLLAEFHGGFARTMDRARTEMASTYIEVGEDCPECGSPLVLRSSRNGEFVACSGYPACKYVKRDPQEEPRATGETCPECGKELVRRRGRFGEFVGCSAYPKCRYIQRDGGPRKPAGASGPIGVPCPNEGCDGQLLRRTTKRGSKREFYGCSRYPKCRFTSSLRPVGRPCPEDGRPLVWQPPAEGDEDAPFGRIVCSARGCDYSERATEGPVENGAEESV
jgi:DNA topoisomerase-1